MGHLGMGELLVILVIVVIIFGASRVPQLGEALGRGIRNFRKSLKGSEDGDRETKDRPSGPPA